MINNGLILQAKKPEYFFLFVDKRLPEVSAPDLDFCYRMMKSATVRHSARQKLSFRQRFIQTSHPG